MTYDSMCIVDTNIYTLLAEFEQAVKLGWYVNSKLPELSGVLKEITVYKYDTPVVEAYKKEGTTAYCQSYEAYSFIKQIQSAIIDGYSIDFKSLHCETLKYCKLKMPYTGPEIRQYSDEELKNIHYDDLKLLAEELGDDVFNRKKSVMQHNVRKALDELFKGE